MPTRLYLPRDELGRGLQSLENRSAMMLLQLYMSLQNSAETGTRRAAILKVEQDSRSHLANIVEYLKIKYTMVDAVDTKSLELVQKSKLYSGISI